ncbi:hypothetical protein MVEG_01378 [Podila verticillata NRRL 6337]|nr:hypothetical protein MVEG_01378 [Podila verticillata NRRL 6337]
MIRIQERQQQYQQPACGTSTGCNQHDTMHSTSSVGSSIAGGRRHPRTCFVYLFLIFIPVLYLDILQHLSHSHSGTTFCGRLDTNADLRQKTARESQLKTVATSFTTTTSSSSSFFCQAAAEPARSRLHARKASTSDANIVEEDTNLNMDRPYDPEYIRPLNDDPGYYGATKQEQIIFGPDEDINSPVPSPHKLKEAEGHETDPTETTQAQIATPAIAESVPKRYLMVDFKLEMGIGEVKTAIEHALYAAHLVQRALVLPPSLYFRGCVNERLCNRMHKEEEFLRQNGEEVVPGKRWAIPIERIYDIKKMRQHVDVVLMDDWVKMMIERERKGTGIEVTAESISSGLEWLKVNRQFTYRAANHDELLRQFTDISFHEQDIYKFLYESMGEVLDSRVGFEDNTPGTIYSYPDSFSRNLNFTWRWDINDTGASYIGFVETFAPMEQEVLYLCGGITKYGKQMLKFGTDAARDAFEDVSMEWVQFSSDLRVAADHLIRNLLKFTGGRNFLAVHYRRGLEFLHAEIPGAPVHLQRFRMGLGTWDPRSTLLRINALLMRDRTVGRFQLEDLDEWTEGVTLNENERERQESQNRIIQDMWDSSPKRQTPLDHSTRERFFFMATDERDLSTLNTIREQGALLLGDLMDEDFVKTHLEMMGFPDWYAYLDQLICIKARSFLGSPMSVFTGSIINQRIRHNRYGRPGNGWLYRPVQ